MRAESVERPRGASNASVSSFPSNPSVPSFPSNPSFPSFPSVPRDSSISRNTSILSALASFEGA